MSQTLVTVAVAVAVGIVVVFVNLAVTTRRTTDLERAIDQLGSEVRDRMDDSIETQLHTVRDMVLKRNEVQEEIAGQLHMLVETQNASANSDNRPFTMEEFHNIGQILTELKSGLTEFQISADAHHSSVVGQLNQLSSIDHESAEMGSLISEASMAHHANVATIRRDLPMLLPTVRLLIGILSGPSNIDRRNECRSTWIREYRRSLGLSRQWSVWFLISAPKNDEEAEQIRLEQQQYGDIMLMSYMTEDYHLIGAKVVEFFHAATLFDQLQFAMKADDDTFVRVDRLLAQLDLNRNGNLFLGCAIKNMPPIRKKNNKRYYTSIEEYSPPSYPYYCSGGGYVLSMDLVKKFDYVGQAAGYEPFKFEDVNTGMLIDSAGLKVEPKSGKGFYCWGPKNKETDGHDISTLKQDWVVYHYVGGKKKWSMAALMNSVNAQEKAIIYQKKIRFQLRDKQNQWGVIELEIFSDTCDEKNTLAKPFGIGALAKKRFDGKATTHDNTFVLASSHSETAHLAFDGDLKTQWASEKTEGRHSIQLMYGYHSISFEEIGCIRIVQNTTLAKAATAIEISAWDDDDAEWHPFARNVKLMTGTTDAYLLTKDMRVDVTANNERTRKK